MKKIVYILVVTAGLSGFAQSGIGTTTPNADASLELGEDNKGFLINRVALTATNSPLPLSNHVVGMMVYNTAITGVSPTNVVEGLYFNTGSKWVLIEFEKEIIIPAGSVKAFAGSTFVSPTGWLKCHGQEVDRSIYNTLFAEIGETYGAGDGNTTFNVPDLRGEFIRGFDDGRGIDADAGRTLASNQDFAIENIIGTSYPGLLNWNGNIVTTTNGALRTVRITKATSNIVPGTQSDLNQKLDFDASRVVNTSTETRPRNVAMNYIIKF